MPVAAQRLGSTTSLLTFTLSVQRGFGAINALFEIGHALLLRRVRIDELDGWNGFINPHPVFMP